nr:SprT family zinc-dependent metalloprotease [Paenibacillus sp. SGZ-1009]
MINITIGDYTVACHVQYSRRGKVSMRMESNGLLTVQAPNGTTAAEIVRIVQRHGDWINEQQHRLASQHPLPQTRAYEDYGTFMLLGQEQPLQKLIDVTDADEQQLRTRLKRYYFMTCKRIIHERITAYQQQLRVKPASIEIVESTTRWGSCSADKKLTFNYRLAMAPVEVIDYVIVHELCHLLHMNHDRSFWRKVGSLMPDYKQKEQYLAQYGRYMTL